MSVKPGQSSVWLPPKHPGLYGRPFYLRSWHATLYGANSHNLKKYAAFSPLKVQSVWKSINSIALKIGANFYGLWVQLACLISNALRVKCAWPLIIKGRLIVLGLIVYFTIAPLKLRALQGMSVFFLMYSVRMSWTHGINFSAKNSDLWTCFSAWLSLAAATT